MIKQLIWLCIGLLLLGAGTVAAELVVGHSGSPYFTAYNTDTTPPIKLPPITISGDIPQNSVTASYWFDNDFLVLGLSASPWLALYDTSTSPYTRLANPGTNPNGQVTDIAVNPAENLVIITNQRTCSSSLGTDDRNMHVYVREGKSLTFSQSSSLSVITASTDCSAWGAAFSSDGNFATIVTQRQPGIRVYSVGATTITGVHTFNTDGGDGTTSQARSTAWLDGSNKFVIGLTTSATRTLEVYSFNGFTASFTDPGQINILLPGSASSGGMKSRSAGDMFVVGHSSSPFFSVYKSVGAGIQRLALPSTFPTGTVNGVNWDSAGELIAMGHSTTPFMALYSLSGETLTQLDNPDTGELPPGTGLTAIWKPGSSAGGDAQIAPPYVRVISQNAGKNCTGSIPENCNIYIEWALTTDDPDLISGSLTYNIYGNGFFLGAATPMQYSQHGSLYRVVKIDSFDHTFGGTGNLFINFQITRVLGGVEGPESCAVFVNIFGTDNKSCGTPPPAPAVQAPLGISVRAENGAVNCISTGCFVDIRWTLSPTDTNQNTGAFNYRVYGNDILLGTFTPPFVNAGYLGIVQELDALEFGGSGNIPITFKIQTQHPSTNAISGFSCSVIVNVALTDTKTCGTIIGYGDTGTIGAPGAPGTPVDIPEYVNTPPPGGFLSNLIIFVGDAWGINYEGMGMILGLIIVAVIVVMVAIKVGPSAAAVLAVGLIAFLAIVGMVFIGLFPVWVLIAVILIIAIVFGRTLFKDSEGSA